MSNTEIIAKKENWLAFIDAVGIKNYDKEGMFPLVNLVVNEGGVIVKQQTNPVHAVLNMMWKPDSNVILGDIRSFWINTNIIHDVISQMNDSIITLEAIQDGTSAIIRLSTSMMSVEVTAISDVNAALVPDYDPLTRWQKMEHEFEISVDQLRQLTSFENPIPGNSTVSISISSSSDGVSVSIGDRLNQGMRFVGKLVCKPTIYEGKSQSVTSVFGKMLRSIVDTIAGSKIKIKMGTQYIMHIHNENVEHGIIADYFIAPQNPQ